MNYGATYDSFKEFTSECYILVPEVLEYFVKKIGDNHEEQAKHLSPIKYENYAKLAKCLIIAAELDPLVDDSKHYYAKLQAENVESSLHVISGIIHGYFSLPLIFKQAFALTEQYVVDFFKSI